MEVFRRIDTDGNGMLDCAEVISGAPILGLTTEEAQTLFDEMSKNDQGCVDPDEFLLGYQKMFPGRALEVKHSTLAREFGKNVHKSTRSSSQKKNFKTQRELDDLALRDGRALMNNAAEAAKEEWLRRQEKTTRKKETGKASGEASAQDAAVEEIMRKLQATVQVKGLEWMEKVFRRADTSSSGALSPKEFRDILNSGRLSFIERANLKMVKAFIEVANEDSDGDLDYEELLQIMSEDGEAGVSEKVMTTAKRKKLEADATGVGARPFGPDFAMSASKYFADFAACFDPMCDETAESEKLCEAKFLEADRNRNGFCSLAELEAFVKSALVAKFPDSNEEDESRGELLFRAFRPSCARAFFDAADTSLDIQKASQNTTQNDFLSKKAFRCFCTYAVMYAAMFDAFCAIDGSDAARTAHDTQKRLGLSEWIKGYLKVTRYGFIALEGLESFSKRQRALDEMDRSRAGGMTLEDWCAFLKRGEIEAGTKLGMQLLVGKLKARGDGPAGGASLRTSPIHSITTTPRRPVIKAGKAGPSANKSATSGAPPKSSVRSLRSQSAPSRSWVSKNNPDWKKGGAGTSRLSSRMISRSGSSAAKADKGYLMTDSEKFQKAQKDERDVLSKTNNNAKAQWESRRLKARLAGQGVSPAEKSPPRSKSETPVRSKFMTATKSSSNRINETSEAKSRILARKLTNKGFQEDPEKTKFLKRMAKKSPSGSPVVRPLAKSMNQSPSPSKFDLSQDTASASSPETAAGPTTEPPAFAPATKLEAAAAFKVDVAPALSQKSRTGWFSRLMPTRLKRVTDLKADAGELRHFGTAI